MNEALKLDNSCHTEGKNNERERRGSEQRELAQDVAAIRDKDSTLVATTWPHRYFAERPVACYSPAHDDVPARRPPRDAARRVWLRWFTWR